HNVLGLLLQCKMNSIVGSSIAGVQGGYDVDRGRQFVRGDGISHGQIQKRHAAKIQPGSQLFGSPDQLFARFDSVNVRGVFQVFEKQVVQNKPQVRFACPMVHEGDGV